MRPIRRDEYDNDFLYCETIIKKHSKNFHTAFSQLPKDKARAVYAVYAFCRRADDAVDEKQDPLLIEAMKKRLEEMQKLDRFICPLIKFR